jgi:hypothetical protein
LNVAISVPQVRLMPDHRCEAGDGFLGRLSASGDSN